MKFQNEESNKLLQSLDTAQQKKASLEAGRKDSEQFFEIMSDLNLSDFCYQKDLKGAWLCENCGCKHVMPFKGKVCFCGNVYPNVA